MSAQDVAAWIVIGLAGLFIGLPLAAWFLRAVILAFIGGVAGRIERAALRGQPRIDDDDQAMRDTSRERSGGRVDRA